jgi:C4-dicarboxylate-specific signal transduction histidine kinase
LSTNSLLLHDDRGEEASWSRYEPERQVSGSALAGVLHDLGQPLAGIRALSSAPLPDGRPAEAADELKERLRRISELGEWMNELLRSGWATAPATRAASAGRERAADAAQVIQEVLLGAVASFTGTLRWRPSGPVTVSVDASDLRRAVANVIDNATRAAGPGGRVVVRTRRAGGRFVIDVEDSGPGFGRVAPQSSQGLAVTQRILDGCRGTLEVGNGRSGGALVRLVLPIAAPGPG